MTKPLKVTFITTVCMLILFAVALPLLWPDASNNYTGIKKEVANYAVSNAWRQSSGTNYASIAGTFRIAVENVAVEHPANKMCNGEFKSSTERDQGNHFIAVLSYRTFFGVALKTETYHICRGI